MQMVSNSKSIMPQTWIGLTFSFFRLLVGIISETTRCDVNDDDEMAHLYGLDVTSRGKFGSGNSVIASKISKSPQEELQILGFQKLLKSNP